MSARQLSDYKELHNLFVRQNQLRNMVGLRQLNPDNPKDNMIVADAIENGLEIENLFEDGELSRDEAQEKYNYFIKCAQQLIEFSPKMRNAFSSNLRDKLAVDAIGFNSRQVESESVPRDVDSMLKQFEEDNQVSHKGMFSPY